MARGRARALAFALLVAAACATRAPRLISPEVLDPTLRLDIRYATANNFVGAPITGYEAARCLLTPEAAQSLTWVQRDLRAAGLTLVIFDCYRPQRAVDEFVRWAADPEDTATRADYYPNVPKSELFARGYIAERSSHSRGSTVDVGLAERRGGALLDMGTHFDLFDEASHTDSPAVTPNQRANRQTLRRAMERHGFVNFPKEWWHYTLAHEPHPRSYFDVPVR